MYRSFKAIILTGAALSVATAANAQSSSLEQRLATLEAMVSQLKSELAAERAQTDAEVIEIKKAVATPSVKAASAPTGSGFNVGGTTFKIGGYVDLDAHVTKLSDGSIGSGSIARDFYIPSVTPIGGPGAEGTTVTDLTAQASRFAISAARDVNGEKASAHIEMDFLGSAQGNERVSSSYSPRLRRAYLDYKGWRIGQEWSTFQNTSAIPESASFLALSDGMIFMRQAQIRYTNGPLQLALENGNATITPAGGAGRIEADGNIIPDVVGRYNMKGDWGNISLAAIGRQLRYETGPIDESTFGIGANVAGRVKMGKGDIRFTVAGGEGLGRYIGLNAANGAAINPATGELEAIPSYGGYIAYRHPFGETARLNAGVSGLFVDNHDFMAGTSTKEIKSAFAAILWDVAPKITVGGEFMYGNKENEAGNNGDFSRFTLSTKYGF